MEMKSFVKKTRGEAKKYLINLLGLNEDNEDNEKFDNFSKLIAEHENEFKEVFDFSDIDFQNTFINPNLMDSITSETNIDKLDNFKKKNFFDAFNKYVENKDKDIFQKFPLYIKLFKSSKDIKEKSKNDFQNALVNLYFLTRETTDFEKYCKEVLALSDNSKNNNQAKEFYKEILSDILSKDWNLGTPGLNYIISDGRVSKVKIKFSLDGEEDKNFQFEVFNTEKIENILYYITIDYLEINPSFVDIKNFKEENINKRILYKPINILSNNKVDITLQLAKKTGKSYFIGKKLKDEIKAEVEKLFDISEGNYIKKDSLSKVVPSFIREKVLSIFSNKKYSKKDFIKLLEENVNETSNHFLNFFISFPPDLSENPALRNVFQENTFLYYYHMNIKEYLTQFKIDDTKPTKPLCYYDEILENISQKGGNTYEEIHENISSKGNTSNADYDIYCLLFSSLIDKLILIKNQDIEINEYDKKKIYDDLVKFGQYFSDNFKEVFKALYEEKANTNTNTNIINKIFEKIIRLYYFIKKSNKNTELSLVFKSFEDLNKFFIKKESEYSKSKIQKFLSREFKEENDYFNFAFEYLTNFQTFTSDIMKDLNRLIKFIYDEKKKKSFNFDKYKEKIKEVFNKCEPNAHLQKEEKGSFLRIIELLQDDFTDADKGKLKNVLFNIVESPGTDYPKEFEKKIFSGIIRKIIVEKIQEILKSKELENIESYINFSGRFLINIRQLLEEREINDVFIKIRNTYSKFKNNVKEKEKEKYPMLSNKEKNHLSTLVNFLVQSDFEISDYLPCYKIKNIDESGNTDIKNIIYKYLYYLGFFREYVDRKKGTFLANKFEKIDKELYPKGEDEERKEIDGEAEYVSQGEDKDELKGIFPSTLKKILKSIQKNSGAPDNQLRQCISYNPITKNFVLDFTKVEYVTKIKEISSKISKQSDTSEKKDPLIVLINQFYDENEEFLIPDIFFIKISAEELSLINNSSKDYDFCINKLINEKFDDISYIMKGLIIEEKEKETEICLKDCYWYKDEGFYNNDKENKGFYNNDNEKVKKIFNRKDSFFNLILIYQKKREEGQPEESYWNDYPEYPCAKEIIGKVTNYEELKKKT